MPETAAGRPELNSRSWDEAIAAIRAEARALGRAEALAAVRAAVEGLIEESGGRCRLPADYDPGEMNVCEQHSELIYLDGCEDQPIALLCVLAAIDNLETP